MKFEEMNLDPRLLKAVQQLGFEQATTIQERAIPLILEGKDVVGQSATGSGKTAAFGLPFLGKIKVGEGLQMMVLTPTRELCVQVAETLHTLGKFMNVKIAKVYGGVGMGPQVDALQTAEIMVGTPGRVLDHLRQGTLHLNKVHLVVLDEADKMFEMGFIEDVEQILDYAPKQRQTLLFSATMSDAVMHLVEKHQHHPVNIKTETYVDRSLLKQIYFNVSQKEKFSLLVHLLKHKSEGMALVFCATRDQADSVSRNLKFNGIKVMAIHGGLSQNKREFALKQLRDENIDVLVATDVAARGLDIKNVTSVYNYDLPKTAEEYIHRIGRTARAGAAGEAVSLLSERDYENFSRVERDRSLHIKEEQLPEFERVKFVREEDRRGGRFGGHAHFGQRGPHHVVNTASHHFHGPRREGGFNRGPREGGEHRGGQGGFHRGPREGGHGSQHGGHSHHGNQRRSRSMTRD
jgi:ATP-dependent RNA helicase DeaD